MAKVGNVDSGGKGAASRERDDEPGGFESLERFAHRSPAELQLCGQVTFDDGLVGADVEQDQLVADHQVRLVGKGERVDVDVVERLRTRNSHGARTFPDTVNSRRATAPGLR